MVSCLRTFSSSTNSSASVRRTSSRSWIVSISSIRSPNTVPWPQPVVTVFLSSARQRFLRAGGDGDRFGLPVDLHRRDLVDRLDQPLVAQVADRERLGRMAERHQRDDLALVDVKRERMLAGDRQWAPSRRARCRPRLRRWPARAALVSFGLRSAADVGHLDFALLRRLCGADLRIAVGAPLPHRGDLVARSRRRRRRRAAAPSGRGRAARRGRCRASPRWKAACGCRSRRTPASPTR